MKRLVIVGADAEFVQRVCDATGMPADDLWCISREEARTELIGPKLPAGEIPEIVLLAEGMTIEERFELAGEFDRFRSEISVVIVGDPSPAMWARALRAGVRDVLSPHADSFELRGVVKRASRTALGRQRALGALMPPVPSHDGAAGRIITVASPKGGCGKTTVATNLAVGLAGIAPSETILVDLDLQFGDVASSLRLDPDHSVVDAVGELAEGDTMVLKTYLDAHSTGCYALCAPNSPADADRVGADQIASLLERLASDFRYVVVDTAPGLTEHTLSALEASNDVVLLAGMDVRSVRGLRREMDVLDDLKLAPIRHLALNLVDRQSGLKIEDVEEILGAPMELVLPRSKAVQLSANRGIPVLQDRQRDPASKALQRFLDRLVPASALLKKGSS